MIKTHKLLISTLALASICTTNAQDLSLDSLSKILGPLSKLKISGYTQFQYVASTDTVSNPLFPIGTYQGGALPTGKLGTNSANNINGIFQIRRDRVRFTYDNDLTTSALEIDALPTGVAIQDAYIQIKDGWLRSFALRAGSQDRPFGFEVPGISTADFELNERTREAQILLPGQKSIGAALFYAPDKSLPNWAKLFNFRGGYFSSTGGQAADVQDSKDYISRTGITYSHEDLGLTLAAGFSTYLGSVHNNSDTSYAVQNGKWTMVTGKSELPRHYLGADYEISYMVPMLGKLQVRGEYSLGRQPGTNSSFAIYSPAASSVTNLNVDTASQGKTSIINSTIGQAPSTSYSYSRPYERNFYAYSQFVSQDLFKTIQLVYRFDVYDPNWDLNRGEITSANGASQYDLTYYTHSLGLTWFITKGFQASVFYDIVLNETSPDSTLGKVSLSKTSTAYNIYTKDLKDNVLTLRLQYRF